MGRSIIANGPSDFNDRLILDRHQQFCEEAPVASIRQPIGIQPCVELETTLPTDTNSGSFVQKILLAGDCGILDRYYGLISVERVREARILYYIVS